MNYDKNGNIQSLQRYGDFDSDVFSAINIDNLTYTYDNDKLNQLVKVTDLTNSPKGFKDDSTGYNDTSDDYVYDANGNLISDENKDITSIHYNYMNLPTEINFGTGNKIEYLYDASGQKQRKRVYYGSDYVETDYLDGFQYTDEKLNFFPHAEGYVNVTLCDECEEHQLFNYVYQYKDHLGNIRVSYGLDPADNVLKILEENHYYPFGLKHTHYNSSTKNYEPDPENPEILSIEDLPPGEQLLNKYKFNGKEYQDELGLNMYDYEARLYDPAIGRWMNIDPLAEKGRRWSPYNYAMDNPMYFLDPDGMLSQSFMDKILSSASGTKWENKNDGTFSDNNGNKIDEDGKAIDGKGGADANREKKEGENGADSETDSFGSSKAETKAGAAAAAAYPDPKSFNFKTRGAWQESAVVGMYFNVSLVKIGTNGVSISYDFTLSFAQAILFTVPTNLSIGGTDITNEVASQATANVVNRVMSKTAKMFAGTEATPMQVEQYFRTELKREYQMSVPGSRVNFNATNYSVKPTLFRHK